MNEVPTPVLGSEPIRLSTERDFALGIIEVRPSLREVRWNGHQEQLEPRVMQVLVALAGAKGAVVSRDALIRRCWEGRIVGEAAINRTIFKLRELSEAGGTSSFRIETIPRVGYRLIPATAAPSIPIANEPVSQAAHDRGTKNRSRMFTIAAAVSAIVLIAAALAIYEAWPRHAPFQPSTQTTNGTSIAVLPFKNLSSDRDAGYLAAGVQDEILTRLAKIGSLKVISRTSADQFAGVSANIPQIARRLGVANVLEGSVQKSGNAVRINVQLIGAATDAHIWAEDYDRKTDDIFSVESEVAGAIASVLAAKVTPVEKAAIAAPPTKNPRAYDLFLRALVFAHKNDASSLWTAIRLLDQAVKEDPKFAVAWAWLVRMKAYIHDGDDLATVRQGSAHAALVKALSLQPDMPETQTAKGFYLYYGEMNYPAALRELEHVHARWPNNADALDALALVLRRLGKWNESRDAFVRLVALDPLVPIYRIALAEAFMGQHDFVSAIRVCDGALRIWPDNGWILATKANAYQEIGQLDQAEALLRNVHPAPDEMNSIWIVERQFWLLRQYRRGTSFIRGLIELEQEGPAADLNFMLGEFLRMGGDLKGARENYSKALEYKLGKLKQQPDDTSSLMSLPLVYAGLGDLGMAMRSADHTIEMLRASNNSLDGTDAADIRVRVMARLGDRGQAIGELARLLNLPGDLTPAVLRLDPDFDRLRGDPRFETLTKADQQALESVPR